jgi:outer membrane protein assembly factor BamB
MFHSRLRFGFCLVGLLTCALSTQPVFVLQAEDENESPAADAKPHQASKVENLWTRQTGDDWPTFLGEQGDSKSREVGIKTDWTGDNLKILWQRPLSESYDIGSISKGRYVQLDREKDQCVVICLHAETGKEIWRYEYPTDYIDLYGYNGGPRCSPVIDDDRVYVYGVEGKLTCLNLVSGKLIWQNDVNKQFNVVQNFFGVGSTPVIFQDLLITMVGGSPKEDLLKPSGQLDQVKGAGSGIVAFDKLTGKVRYQITDALASYASLQLARIGQRDWCFAFVREGLIGFEPATGKVDFEFPWRAAILESVNASAPVVIDDQVFISETYGPGSALLKVATGHQEVVWQDELRSREKAMQTHWNTAIEHAGFVYGSSGRHSHNAELRCIELATGKVQWSQADLSRCSLLYVDQRFICLTEYGSLILFKANAKEFEPITSIKLTAALDPDDPASPRAPLLNYPCWAAPILSHGLLYVRGDDRVVCLELIPEKEASTR